MAKRHRKPENKTRTEAEQSASQRQNKIGHEAPVKGNDMTIQLIWGFVTVVSVLLNFWLAYLALTPKVTIDYASHLIPENPIALPIKISNIGLLPVYDVECFIEDKDMKLQNNKSSSGNKTQQFITKKLSPNKPSEYVYNSIAIMDNPISGDVLVTLRYKLPLLQKTITSEPDVFSIYKSKDGFVRWIHR